MVALHLMGIITIIFNNYESIYHFHHHVFAPGQTSVTHSSRSISRVYRKAWCYTQSINTESSINIRGEYPLKAPRRGRYLYDFTSSWKRWFRTRRGNPARSAHRCWENSCCWWRSVTAYIGCQTLARLSYGGQAYPSCMAFRRIMHMIVHREGVFG